MGTQMEHTRTAGKPVTEHLCDHCSDAPAAWVIDRDMTHGGGEDGPEWDAPVYRVACEWCRGKSSYMEPEPLTAEWVGRLGL